MAEYQPSLTGLKVEQPDGDEQQHDEAPVLPMVWDTPVKVELDSDAEPPQLSPNFDAVARDDSSVDSQSSILESSLISSSGLSSATRVSLMCAVHVPSLDVSEPPDTITRKYRPDSAGTTPPQHRQCRVVEIADSSGTGSGSAAGEQRGFREVPELLLENPADSLKEADATEVGVPEREDTQGSFPKVLCISGAKQRKRGKSRQKLERTSLTCQECGMTFSTRGALVRHVRIHTNERPFKCAYCNATFRAQSTRQNHERIHTNERPYKCDHCDSCFRTKSARDSHLNTHTEQRPFVCRFCSGKFKTKKALELHMRIHTDERPFHCDLCEAAFRRPSSLTYHRRLHTGERPHRCVTCGWCFVTKNQLVIHTRRHAMVKPYKCAQCPAAFTRVDILRRHERLGQHDPNVDPLKPKPYKCDRCSAAYVWLTSYQRHIRKGLCVTSDERSQRRPKLLAASRLTTDRNTIAMVEVRSDAERPQLSAKPDSVVGDDGNIGNCQASVSESSLTSAHSTSSVAGESVICAPSLDVEEPPDIVSSEECSDSVNITPQYHDECVTEGAADGARANLESAEPVVSDVQRSSVKPVVLLERLPESSVKAGNFSGNAWIGSLDAGDSTGNAGDSSLDAGDNISSAGASLLNAGESPAKAENCSLHAAVGSTDARTSVANAGGSPVDAEDCSVNSGDSSEKGDATKISASVKKDLQAAPSKVLRTVGSERGARGKSKRKGKQASASLTCQYCGVAFLKRSNLVTHMRIHTNERPYKCTYCPATFRVKSTRQNHERIHTKEKPYKCDDCGACFRTKSARDTHLITHTDERPFICRLCSAKFKTKKQLQFHTRIHTDERPFRCDLCEATFRCRNSLTSHRRLHTGERPHRCVTCGWCFVTKSQLVIHSRKHTGVKPYKCGKCPAAFTQLGSLRQHEKLGQHNPNVDPFKPKPYKCERCSAAYVWLTSFQRHIRKGLCVTPEERSRRRPKPLAARRAPVEQNTMEIEEWDSDVERHQSSPNTDDPVGKDDNTDEDHHTSICESSHASTSDPSSATRESAMSALHVLSPDVPEPPNTAPLEHRLDSVHTTPRNGDCVVDGATNDPRASLAPMESATSSVQCPNVNPVVVLRRCHRGSSNRMRNSSVNAGDSVGEVSATKINVTRKQDVQSSPPEPPQTVGAERRVRGKSKRKQKQTLAVFTCQECGVTFSTRGALVRHTRIHTDERPFKCAYCDATFRAHGVRQNHERIHTNERPYKCDHCDACFRTRSTRDSHLNTHTDQRPFVCRVCNAKFKAKKPLGVHMRSHTDERPFHCDLCQAAFRRGSSLTYHRRLHTGERPHRCATCGWRFVTKNQLVVHARRHAEVKPYKCTECSASFTQAGSLRQHERLGQHNRNVDPSKPKPYKCERCSAAYTRLTSLQRHIRKGPCVTPEERSQRRPKLLASNGSSQDSLNK